MTKEDVVKALKICAERNMCESSSGELCPYMNIKGGCQKALSRDILELLNPTPHLLTEDDLKALQPGESAWCDWKIVHKDDGSVSAGIEHWVCTPDDELVTDGISVDKWKAKIVPFKDANDAYEYERYWSAKPSDELRKETEWYNDKTIEC